LLAATGLVIWIIYVANDSDSLAWVAFVLLAIVAALGWTMFAIWYQRRQAAQPPRRVSPASPALRRRLQSSTFRCRSWRCTACSP
jgi:hypothetical protein